MKAGGTDPLIKVSRKRVSVTGLTFGSFGELVAFAVAGVDTVSITCPGKPLTFHLGDQGRALA